MRNGETIPYAGATFEIYDPDGNLVTMTTTYPEVQEHTQFVTNEEGWLITPEVLPFGEGYSIVEVEAPYGYVLNSDPVFFDVTPENAVSEDGIVLVIAEKENARRKDHHHRENRRGVLFRGDPRKESCRIGISRFTQSPAWKEPSLRSGLRRTLLRRMALSVTAQARLWIP